MHRLVVPAFLALGEPFHEVPELWCRSGIVVLLHLRWCRPSGRLRCRVVAHGGPEGLNGLAHRTSQFRQTTWTKHQQGNDEQCRQMYRAQKILKVHRVHPSSGISLPRRLCHGNSYRSVSDPVGIAADSANAPQLSEPTLSDPLHYIDVAMVVDGDCVRCDEFPCEPSIRGNVGPSGLFPHPRVIAEVHEGLVVCSQDRYPTVEVVSTAARFA